MEKKVRKGRNFEEEGGSGTIIYPGTWREQWLQSAKEALKFLSLWTSLFLLIVKYFRLLLFCSSRKFSALTKEVPPSSLSVSLFSPSSYHLPCLTSLHWTRGSTHFQWRPVKKGNYSLKENTSKIPHQRWLLLKWSLFRVPLSGHFLPPHSRKTPFLFSLFSVTLLWSALLSLHVIRGHIKMFSPTKESRGTGVRWTMSLIRKSGFLLPARPHCPMAVVSWRAL
jgi:hypothetical protein